MAPKVKKWWGIVGDYTFYVKSTYFKFIASHVKTRPQAQKDYDIRGKSISYLARYHVPFNIFSNAANEIIFGYDYKKMNDFTRFCQRKINDNNIAISQFVLQLKVDSTDKYGLTSAFLSLYISPGKMVDYNNRKDFKSEKNAENCQYFYSLFHFDRTFYLPNNFLYVMDFFSQISSTRLLPTEQMQLGGYWTIRGYQENALYGDHGFYLKNEIRSNKIVLKNIKNLSHKLQLLAFVDFGFVADINKNISNKNSSILASFGPGLRYLVNDNLMAKLDYGVQLKNLERKYFKRSAHSRLHAFVSLQY